VPGRTAGDPHAAVRSMRAIGLAMAGAVTIFALVALLLHRQSPPPGAGPLMLYLWIAVATSLAAASIVWWRGNVVPLIERAEGDDWRGRAARIQAGLVVCWALVEAGALFGVVVYFLEGAWPAGALGVAMMWLAVALTWPRTGWLATSGAAPG
jgi:F0F1-type ATP synthase membrane subunit c/vacuolar-type H+-ATPase subunit K